MKNKIILIGGVLLGGGLLAGCNQVSPQVPTQPKSLNQTQQQEGGKSGNNKVTQSYYKVDSSDVVRPNNLLSSLSVGDLSDEEKKGLIQMREEEKLAHDVYTTLHKKWGQRIFDNISGSEQTHTDTIKYLLEKYNIVDPVKDNTVGVFTDKNMQELYNSLVAQGDKSLTEGLKVGVTIEDLDIKDLNEFIAKTDNEDILVAYQNLNKGSRNHMRAFIRNLERNGASYQPQFISQGLFDEIISGEQERGQVDKSGKSTGGSDKVVGQGRGNGNGQGMGRGQGNGKR